MIRMCSGISGLNRRLLGLLIAALISVGGARGAEGQEPRLPGVVWIGAVPDPAKHLHDPPFRPPETPASARAAIPVWIAPLLSGILPGAGQLALGQDRAAGYLAVELYAWIQYTRNRADGARARDSYRELAADVSRALFSVDRPTGSFEYYETMERFVESGVYDAGGGVLLTPEADETTYNGFIWRRARETFWADPLSTPPVNSAEWIRAVNYYQERAVRPEFRWSWRDAQLEYDLFRSTISRSNEAYRRSVRNLGVILGNHVLSLVDAFVTVRIRAESPGDGGGVGIWTSIPFEPGHPNTPR